jgi:hypothetical protein
VSVPVGKTCNELAPKRRQRHYSYDESLDEAAKLDEPPDAEAEAPGGVETRDCAVGEGIRRLRDRM